MKLVKFYQDNKKEWRWQIRSTNNRIVADCGEGYQRRSGAVNGFKAMLKSLLKSAFRILE